MLSNFQLFSRRKTFKILSCVPDLSFFASCLICISLRNHWTDGNVCSYYAVLKRPFLFGRHGDVSIILISGGRRETFSLSSVIFPACCLFYCWSFNLRNLRELWSWQHHDPAGKNAHNYDVATYLVFKQKSMPFSYSTGKVQWISSYCTFCSPILY